MVGFASAETSRTWHRSPVVAPVPRPPTVPALGLRVARCDEDRAPARFWKIEHWISYQDSSGRSSCAKRWRLAFVDIAHFVLAGVRSLISLVGWCVNRAERLELNGRPVRRQTSQSRM